MPKKTLIITGPDRAKEIGPPYPDISKMQGLKFIHELNKWNKKQSSLKEYRITYKQVSEFAKIGVENWSRMPAIGTKVECDCNEEELTCIIP